LSPKKISIRTGKKNSDEKCFFLNLFVAIYFYLNNVCKSIVCELCLSFNDARKGKVMIFSKIWPLKSIQILRDTFMPYPLWHFTFKMPDLKAAYVSCFHTLKPLKRAIKNTLFTFLIPCHVWHVKFKFFKFLFSDWYIFSFDMKLKESVFKLNNFLQNDKCHGIKS